eukprot:gnl/TRDRNA2_/TRDRNA2_168625_c1_seq1.p1 gnl/TRDRNA2_/TRDRNA2_168625_c1~~gnl/TRDRNA2_/TRDRNA2_168625_c1_seq1.p1  ORF type:complete len:115 (-),score=24.49 gnl/TRDRNA2_/TRDRNA2_168625_c1_seq1:28-330(-)
MATVHAPALQTASQLQFAREEKEINRSLLSLNKVFCALAPGGSGLVPFRSSRLTRLARPWLQEGCRCALLASVSSADIDAKETVRALEYVASVAAAGLKP